MSRLQRYYFETSALNSFAASHNIEDAIATKALQNLKGRGWYISPVVIWEILLTNNAEQRDALLYFSQHLFESDLLPSPEELIVKYLASGCPVYENEYPLVSKGIFSESWREICCIKEKTLRYRPEKISETTRVLRDIARLFHEFSRSHSIDITAKQDIVGVQVSVQQVLDRFAVVPKDYRDDPEALRHFRLVAFYILMIVCAGASVDMEVIEGYWKTQGARSMQERIDMIFSQYPQLVLHGPFNQIAYMTSLQSEAKFSRGVYFDSLHTIYSIYADKFLTGDNHFRILRDYLKEEYPYIEKIRHMDELVFTSSARINPPQESFLLRKT